MPEKKTTKASAPAQGETVTFDAVRFAREFSKWLAAGGDDELDQAMEPARRDARRLKRALEVRPEMLSEAVTY